MVLLLAGTVKVSLVAPINGIVARLMSRERNNAFVLSLFLAIMGNLLK